MAASGVKLKMNRKNVYRILGLTGTQLAMNEYGDAIQRAAESNDPKSDYVADEHTAGSGYKKRRTSRVYNTSPLGWVREFGSYGGGISYDVITGRGPHPGFTDEGGPSRMQRTTGRRTGVVQPHFGLLKAALAARGTKEYLPDKVDGP
jgi:hypothetical protein